jgi:hypothetical protein
MFQALLALLQEELHAQQLVYFVLAATRVGVVAASK